MNWHLSSSLLITALLLLTSLGSSHNEGRDFYCNPEGPPIRFPFHLIHTNNTDHSGFGLSCSNNNTILQLPTVPIPVKLHIRYIDYGSRIISVTDPDDCYPRLLLKIYNSSIYPFRFYPWEETNVTFFNCSSQDTISCPIYAFDSDQSVVGFVSCTKMIDIVSPIPSSYLDSQVLSLSWSEPNCDAEYFDCKA